MSARPPFLLFVSTLALLGVCGASACDRPHDARVPVAASDRALDASPPPQVDAALGPLDAGVEQDATPPPEDAASAVAPTWASGSVADRLYALRVNDDNWARRDFVTWTTPPQIDAMRSSRVLLVATAKVRGPPSPFVWLLATLSQRKSPAGALAGVLSQDPRFAKRRYAWSAGYATVLGLASKRYGNELVAVRLRKDALIVAIAPGRDPPVSVRDTEQREIPLERALDQAARIGAVYHVRTGKDVPARFREYVLVNEAAIERWAVGTPDIHAEVNAEAALLRALQTQLGSTPIAVEGGDPLEAWKYVDATSSLRALWQGTLAFQNDRYVLAAPRLSAALAALLEYDRGAPALDVQP